MSMSKDEFAQYLNPTSMQGGFAQLITTKGEVTSVNPENGKTFSLSELQKMVGGYIEIIPFQNQVMVVNEEGKINGSKLNEEASVIFSNTYGHIDAIYGNVIMCSSELIN